MKRVFWKMPSILAVFGLALVTAGCPTEPETQTNGPVQGALGLVTVTVTGIPAGHQNQRANLSLRHLTSGAWATGGEAEIEGSSATFSLAAFSGTYSVELRFGYAFYLMSSRNITAGIHSIPFSAFTPFEQVSVTVTGIPDRYISSSGNQIRGRMYTMRPGTFARQGSWISNQTISGASATFSIGVIPGSYDVHLRFLDHSWNIIRAYSAPSRNIAAGTNAISFSYFAVIEPIIVTITGIPNRYIGVEEFSIFFNTPGIVDLKAYNWSDVESSSVIVTLFAMPRTYDIAMWFAYVVEGGVWKIHEYSAPSRNITAGTNTISFSAFVAVPPMSVTVTGIPSEYIEGEKQINLTFPSTDVYVAIGWNLVTGTSATIDFRRFFDEWMFNTAGTYDVHLRFWTEDGKGEYFIPSRHLNAGSNTIPFSAFTPVTPGASSSVRGFTEKTAPTERTMPGRFGVKTRSLTDR